MDLGTSFPEDIFSFVGLQLGILIGNGLKGEMYMNILKV